MSSLRRTLFAAPRQFAGRAFVARPATAARFYSDATTASSSEATKTTTASATPSSPTPATQSQTPSSTPSSAPPPSTPKPAPNGAKPKPATQYGKSTIRAPPARVSNSAAAAAAAAPAPYQATTIGFSPSKAHATKYDVDVDWANTFHGISTRPVTSEQFKVLMRPLEEHDIEVKPDGIIYLPEIKYRRRLNEAFGPMGWGLIPRGEAVVGQTVVTREYALIIDGRFVSQAQGENNYFGAENLPSAVEGCKSNALMRCCKDLGIGSELWDPQFIRAFKKTKMEEVWVEHSTTKKKRPMWFRKGQVELSYPWKRS